MEYNEWRLPRGNRDITQTATLGYDIPESEMSHLYDELLNEGGSGGNWYQTDDFANIKQTSIYWLEKQKVTGFPNAPKATIDFNWVGEQFVGLDTKDYNVLAVFDGEIVSSGPGPVDPVPEPGTYALLTIGMIGLAGLRKKFKK